MTLRKDLRRLNLSHRVRARKREQSLLMRANKTVGLPGTTDYLNHIQGEMPSTFRTDYNYSHAAMS